MVVPDHHERLNFSYKVIDELNLHFDEVVLDILVHFFNVRHDFSDLKDHFGVMFRNLHPMLKFSQKLQLHFA